MSRVYSGSAGLSRAVLMIALLLGVTAVAVVQSGSAVTIRSGGRSYASYLVVPDGPGQKPAVVLLHSNRGLEQGYRELSERLAAEGYVSLALGWQSIQSNPPDSTVAQLVRDGIAFLRRRSDVDASSIGLTGFCAGGRYTMLLLPQISELAAGVAWYGFPNAGDPAPVDLVDRLSVPIAILQGTADRPSPIATIYDYAQAVDAAGKYVELNVYQGEPHRFMVPGDTVSESLPAQNAFESMLSFWERMM